MRFAGVVRDAAHAALDHAQGAFLGVRACELAETDGPRSRSGSRMTARNRKPGRVARSPTGSLFTARAGIGVGRHARPLSELRPAPIPRVAQVPTWLSEVFGVGSE